MELKVGGAYRTRDGQRAVLEERRKKGFRPWVGQVDGRDKFSSCWADNGKWMLGESGPLDLVAPWTDADEAAPEVTAAPDGGPAFAHGDPTHGGHPGMTLHEWYAGQALVGLMAEGPHDCGPEGIAHDAYLLADAMMAERERRRKGAPE